MAKVKLKLDPDALGKHNKFKEILRSMGLSREEVNVVHELMQKSKVAAFDSIERTAEEAPLHLQPLIRLLTLDCFLNNSIPGFQGMLMAAFLRAKLGDADAGI